MTKTFITMRIVSSLLLLLFILPGCTPAEKTAEEKWAEYVEALPCKTKTYNVAIISKVDCTSCEVKLEEFFEDPSFKSNTLFVCEDTREKEIMYWQKKYPFFKKVKVIFSSEIQKFLMGSNTVLTTLQVRDKKSDQVVAQMTFREMLMNPGKLQEIKGCM
ncbi:MAG: hypothetical protein N4A41_07595 [Crocinitomicaceae bacterium]|nr:hypothetical protein [Crocinitomicaceae bacterium]